MRRIGWASGAERRPGADLRDQAARPFGERHRAQMSVAGERARIDQGDGDPRPQRLLDRRGESEPRRPRAGDDDVEDARRGGGGHGRHCGAADAARQAPAVGRWRRRLRCAGGQNLTLGSRRRGSAVGGAPDLRRPRRYGRFAPMPAGFRLRRFSKADSGRCGLRRVRRLDQGAPRPKRAFRPRLLLFCNSL